MGTNHIQGTQCAPWNIHAYPNICVIIIVIIPITVKL